MDPAHTKISQFLSLPPPPQPTYRLEELLPQFVLAWVLTLGISLLFHFTKRWSVSAISSVSAAHIVLTSLCFFLGGYTTLLPTSQAEFAAAAAATTLNATAALASFPGASWASSVYLLGDNTAAFNDEMPAPFILGLASLSLPGAGAYPMFPRFSFVFFFIPVAWLVANVAWAQPRDQLLQVALLHTFLLFQVTRSLGGAGRFINV